MDWDPHHVLAHRVSISLSADFCVEALQEAIAKYGAPGIFNNDQGSQFTSVEFTSVFQGHGIKISMDSKGRRLDNVFVERLWRSVGWYRSRRSPVGARHVWTEYCFLLHSVI